MPEATLFGHHGRVAGKHYAGPTWEANDGSTVVGAKYLAHERHPTFIDRFLFDEDLSAYLEPWRFSRINTVDRILLGSRLDRGEPFALLVAATDAGATILEAPPSPRRASVIRH
ncbi:hypothetical protein BH11MYX4_BH11MYX4_06510 [soil metagenome]